MPFYVYALGKRKLNKTKLVAPPKKSKKDDQQQEGIPFLFVFLFHG